MTKLGTCCDRKIITISGSTKFRKGIKELALSLTKLGYLVLFAPFAKEEIPDLEDFREELEIQHNQKIYISNIVLIYNKNGYIGEHTKSELHYAVCLEKEIWFLEKLDENSLAYFPNWIQKYLRVIE